MRSGYLPFDTEKEFYFDDRATMFEILREARSKWGPGINMDHIDISIYVHDSDRETGHREPCDWSYYLHITLKK